MSTSITAQQRYGLRISPSALPTAKTLSSISFSCTTNCKDALEHIVELLAVKFDANLTNKSEMIYDTVMSW